MLVRTMQERALGALLGAEGTATALYEHLVDWWQVNAGDNPKAIELPSLHDKLQKAIVRDIDARTGNRYRVNEIELVSQTLCESLFLDATKNPVFDDLMEAVLEWDEGAKSLYFREEQVQRYAQLIAELDPTVLAARFLAKRARQDQWSKQSVRDTILGLKTLLVGPRFFSQTFAEGHVHLKGIDGEELVLAQLILGHQWPDQFKVSETHVGRLRRIRRMLVALTKVWSEQGKSATEQEAVILGAVSDDACLVPQNPTIDWEVLLSGLDTDAQPDIASPAAQNGSGQRVSDRWLLIQLASDACKHNLQHAWAWMFFLLWRTYQFAQAKRSTRAAILLMIADIMVLRRQLIMDGSGLRRFTRQFFSPLRADAKSHQPWEETSGHEAAKRLFARHGDKAEIKLNMGGLKDSRTVLSFAQNVCAHLQSLPDPDSPLAVVESRSGHAYPRSHWHICANFNRHGKTTRSRLWKEARDLNKVLNSVQPWDLAPPTDIMENESGYLVHPAELIRGLDVVGDETQWSIERFAPMLRWLRDQVRSPALRNDAESFNVPEVKLHFSIHAGEDYAHPLSGLRHVEETVRFCNMRRGDRLGHALALGIAPHEWMAGHGEAVLSVDEHVDNLVWAWREAGKRRSLKEAQCVLPRLEKRIARLLRHVSWYPWQDGMPEPTKDDILRLYGAWKLRRNCAHLIQSEICPTGIAESEMTVGVPDIKRLDMHLKSPTVETAEGLYVLRARLETNSPMENPKRLVHVRLSVLPHGHLTRRQTMLEAQVPEETPGGNADSITYVYDHDDPDDLDFMLALQDIGLERYSRMGLSIETNPSSNVYIGQLKTHGDHPIYRWNPPDLNDLVMGERFNLFGLRTRPMPVTINTDDPGLIPTTLRMEHHLMHEAALDHGHALEVADIWIERIRQQGVENFDRAH